MSNINNSEDDTFLALSRVPYEVVRKRVWNYDRTLRYDIKRGVMYDEYVKFYGDFEEYMNKALVDSGWTFRSYIEHLTKLNNEEQKVKKSIRNKRIGFCIAFVALASFVVCLPYFVSIEAPNIISVILYSVAVFCGLLVPDTMNKIFPYPKDDV